MRSLLGPASLHIVYIFLFGSYFSPPARPFILPTKTLRSSLEIPSPPDVYSQEKEGPRRRTLGKLNGKILAPSLLMIALTNYVLVFISVC